VLVYNHNLKRYDSNRQRHAYTLIEILIVIVIIGIAVSMALPTISNTQGLRVREAARMLAADIEFALSESITHGDNPRLIKFDTVNNNYWIATALYPDTPITGRLIGRQLFITSAGSYPAELDVGQFSANLRAEFAGRDIHLDPNVLVSTVKNGSCWSINDSHNALRITQSSTNLIVSRDEPYQVAFGTGRAEGIKGVTIQTVNLNTGNILQFDQYGTPNLDTNGAITLNCGNETITVIIDATTGEVSIP